MSQRLGVVALRVRVLGVGATYEVGENNLQKREMICRTDGDMYPQDYKIEFIKDKVALLDDVKEDTFITVWCNTRGNRVKAKPEDENQEDKFFPSLQCWKIEE